MKDPMVAASLEPAFDASALPTETSTLGAALRQSCALHGARPALTDRGRTLTYAELLADAEAVARSLATLELPAHSLIGICLDRSAGLIVSMLGVILAGHAYLPLDPAYPEAHLLAICVDARIAALLSGSAEALPGLSLPRLLITGTQVFPQAASMQALPVQDDPDGLAYVLYTSGSTGSPKGVMVSHWNVLRLIVSTRPLFQFTPDDVWTMFHSPSFDFSVWEMWGALLSGGRLVVVPFDVSRSPELFRVMLSHERVTVLNQTPTAFRLLDEADSKASTPLFLRYILFGGEALVLRSLLSWTTRHGDMDPQLFNLYGITETTVHVTARCIRSRDVERETDSLIGEPLPDLQLYLLDDQRCPVPAEATGELYVGGAGVALGYLHQPDLTAERFLQNPFASSPTHRLYRTGDLARRREDGELVYLGRADRQVKINGFRLELAEVEAALLRSPAVAQVCVAMVLDKGLGPRLAAWYTPQPGATLADLTRHSRETLPAHMRPSLYQVVERLPLTVNGKLDIAALPVPEPPPTAIRATGSLDNLIAEHCSELFGRTISPTENFFDAGATSVQLIALRARLELALTRRLPITWLFQHTSVHALARKLEEPTDFPCSPSQAEAPADARPAQRSAWLAAQARRKQAR